MTKKLNSGKLFVISAPSGGGKTSLVKALLAKLDRTTFKKVVTFTSRLPRVGEINGMDYYFVSKEDFENKIKEGFFIEWSTAYGTYYGCPRYILDEIESGISYFVIVDQSGAKSIKSFYPKSILIWLRPPSIQSLKERLTLRATDSQEQIEYRIALSCIVTIVISSCQN